MSIVKASDDLNTVVVRILRDATLRSSCRRRQVGAALFDAHGNLLSVGWNNERDDAHGATRNCSHGECPRGMVAYSTVPADAPYGDCIAQHAEMMALELAHHHFKHMTEAEKERDLRTLLMFVTHRPCHECTPVLVALGINVTYLEEL